MTEFQSTVMCNSCGKSHPRWAKFCPQCGQQVDEVMREEMSMWDLTHCSSCGTKLEPEAIYCLECGLAVDQMDPYSTGGTKEQTSEAEVNEYKGDDDYPEKRYKALNFLSILFWVIGIFLILLGFAGGFRVVTTLGFDGFLNFIIMLATVLGTLGFATGLFALAEFIRLFMDMEENQRLQILALDDIIKLLND